MARDAIDDAAVFSNDTGRLEAFFPVLQREDGSYIGTDSDTRVWGTNLVAIGVNGGILWKQQISPLQTALIPLYATSDGGMIVRSTQPDICRQDPSLCQNPISDVLYTVAVDGTVTDQSPDTGAVYSWKGQWYDSAVGGATVSAAIALPPFLPARSLGAFYRGNPSMTDAAARPWYFILVWQNEFDFIPDLPSIREDLKTDITYDAVAIKTAALNALKQAYSNKSWRVIVVEGKMGTGDHRAVVQTSFTGPECGDTNPNQAPPTDSTVSYECNMKQAQVALQVVINNAQDEVNALKRQDLIQAIGRGIGNTAAHEIAHQFLGLCCSMDVLTSQDPNAAATYNNGDAGGDPSPQVIDSDPAPYTGYGKDGKTPIHWENTTEQALTKCLASGWTDYGLTSCAVKLQLSLNNLLTKPPTGTWAKAVIPPGTNLPLLWIQKLVILPLLSHLKPGEQ